MADGKPLTTEQILRALILPIGEEIAKSAHSRQTLAQLVARSFTEPAHFIERMKANPNERVTFYGMEKNPTTIRLAKMNLAVHGLEGNIAQAISYYEDPHAFLGKADFVMANPPFNVDEIDAEKIKTDPRLTFGLPGTNPRAKSQTATMSG